MTHLLLIAALLGACGIAQDVNPIPVEWGHTYTCTVDANPACTVPAEHHSSCVVEYIDAWQPIADACLDASCAAVITCDRDFFPCVL